MAQQCVMLTITELGVGYSEILCKFFLKNFFLLLFDYSCPHFPPLLAPALLTPPPTSNPHPLVIFSHFSVNLNLFFKSLL